MVYFAMNALLQSLAPLIGYEALVNGGKAASKGWADGSDIDMRAEWKEKGMKMEGELRKEFFEVFEKKYLEIMAKVSLHLACVWLGKDVCSSTSLDLYDL